MLCVAVSKKISEIDIDRDNENSSHRRRLNNGKSSIDNLKEKGKLLESMLFEEKNKENNHNKENSNDSYKQE